MTSSHDILEALRRLEESLVARLSGQMAEFRLEVNGRFDAIEVRLERLETEYQMIAVALRRIEERLEDQSAEQSRLRSQLADLKERMRELDARVREIEARLDDQ